MLKIVSRSTALVALGASLLFSSGSQALVVDQMFAFGDSLSDPGNAARLTQLPSAPGSSLFPPSQPNLITGSPPGIPYDYRFSNGPTAIEQLAGLLGIAPSDPAWPALPANSNTNFAVGGAMTGPQPNPFGGAPPAFCCNYNWLVDSPEGLRTGKPAFPDGFPDVAFTGINNQIDLFASRNLAFDPARTLFSVWGGANDIFLAVALGLTAGLPPDQLDGLLQLYASTAVNNIGLGITQLDTLGAQNVLVLNMPDLGRTPLGLTSGLGMELTKISNLFNLAMDGTLTQLRNSLGLDIIEFDTYDALNDLIDGNTFANTTTPCLDTTDDGTVAATLPNVLVGGCQGYLFFDSVHPTTATAGILAQQILVAMPEPDMPALLATALMALCWVHRSHARRFARL